MPNWPNWMTNTTWGSRLSSPTSYQDQQRQELEAIREEQRKILELAGKFDQLSLAGYDEVMRVMQARVNDEVSLARTKPDLTQAQLVHVVRWNAMQDVLDAGANFINDTLKRRDEIKKAEREAFLEEAARIRGGDVQDA